MAPHQILLLLSIAAPFSVCSETHFVAVREGADAVLSCGSSFSPRCEVDWYFLEESRSTALIVGGAGPGGGASLLKNCSLFLHNVTREQAGYYSCTATGHQQEADTDTVLSVITVAERRDGAALTLTCFVRTVHFYKPGLTWLNEGEEVPEDHRQLKISRSNSSISVSLNDTDRTSPFYHSLSCRVTDGDRQQEEESSKRAWPFRDFLLRHVVLSAGLVVLLLVCIGASFHKWTRANQTKRDPQRPRPSVRYVGSDDNSSDIYEVIEEPSASTNP